MHVRAAKAIEEDGERWSIEEQGAPDKVPTVFQTILSSSLPLREKERDRMAQEGFIIIVAGSDTISRVFTAATYHTLANEMVLVRLREELRTAIPDPNKDVELKAVESLPWLVRHAVHYCKDLAYTNGQLIREQTAVIKEGLRIAALLTSRLPLISPNKSMWYGDWEIPAGVSDRQPRSDWF